MHGLHETWAFVAVACCGLVGLWGLAAALTHRTPGTLFRWACALAVVVALAQVAFGLLLLRTQGKPDDQFHVFYGFVILFTFAFAYIFRSQMGRRPALAWGILLLFVMGLGLRAWATGGG